MPSTLLNLTVSLLPRSVSFYAAALQPLGYRYFGHEDSRVAFAAGSKADFFLSQAGLTQPGQTGPIFITFYSPSLDAVDSFYSNAIRAGAVSLTPPTSTASYSTKVLDLDSNIVEVYSRTSQSISTMSSRHPEEARVMSWQRDVARSLSDQSEVSHAPRRSNPRTSQPRQATVIITQPAPSNIQVTAVDSTMSSSKALIGTLIGAAAGATIAYAMTKAEAQDDAAAATTTTYHQIQPSSQSYAANVPPSGRRSSVSYSPRPIYSNRAIENAPFGQSNTLANTITTLISSLDISPSAPVSSRPTAEYQAPAMPYTISEPTTIDASKSPTSRSSHRQQKSSDYKSTSRVSSKHSRSQQPISTISISTTSNRDTRPARLIALPASASTVYDDSETVVPKRRGGSKASHKSRRGEDYLTPNDSISQVSSRHSSSPRSNGRREDSRVSRRSEAIGW